MSKKDQKAYRNVDTTTPMFERVIAQQISICEDPDYHGWDTDVCRGARLVSAEEGRTVHEMTITKAMCNKSGNLHGGCAATILDNLSSIAFATVAKPGFMDTGSVSRTITMTYLRALPAGTKVQVFSEAVSAGRTLAHCKSEMRTLDGKVCVTCVHDKAVVKPKL